MKAYLINYVSAGTKVKVICKGQGQIQRLHFSKNGRFGGIRVSQTHLVFFFSTMFNSLPNYNFIDWSKFNGFADDKINVTEKLIENWLPAFSPFPTIF